MRNYQKVCFLLVTTLTFSCNFGNMCSVKDAYNTSIAITANADEYYSPSAATAYAEQYWSDYNPSYSNYNSIGGDCANFVSQCLHAGGLEMTDGWYWYSYNNRSASWASCSDMYNYFNNAGYTIIENPSNDEVLEGNPVLYWRNGRWGHAAICVGENNGVPVVAAHNNDRWRVNWTLGYSKTCTILINNRRDPDKLPGKPNPVIPKTLFSVDETVDITWDTTENTSSYWLHIYRNGKDYVNQSINKDLSYSATYPVGEYTAFIVACNNCGETSSYVDFTVYDDVPPAPHPQIERKYFSSNEEINITWNSTPITTHYWLHTYKDGEDFENKDMYDNLSYSRTYPAGNYTLYIASYNEYDYSAECVEFIVYDRKPEWAKVSTDKQEAMVGEEIIFTLTSDTGHAYTIGIDDEKGNRLITYDTTVNQNETTQHYIHTFNKSGNYSCYITTYNNYGLADSERIYFTVIGKNGDINSDNSINTVDIVLLEKYLKNKETFTQAQYEIADMNQDGNVNIYDFILLKRELLKK